MSEWTNGQKNNHEHLIGSNGDTHTHNFLSSFRLPPTLTLHPLPEASNNSSRKCWSFQWTKLTGWGKGGGSQSCSLMGVLLSKKSAVISVQLRFVQAFVNENSCQHRKPNNTHNDTMGHCKDSAGGSEGPWPLWFPKDCTNPFMLDWGAEETQARDRLGQKTDGAKFVQGSDNRTWGGIRP